LQSAILVGGEGGGSVLTQCP